MAAPRLKLLFAGSLAQMPRSGDDDDDGGGGGDNDNNSNNNNNAIVPLKMLRKRVAKLHGSKHGPFAAVFCVGSAAPVEAAASDLEEPFPVPIVLAGSMPSSCPESRTKEEERNVYRLANWAESNQPLCRAAVVSTLPFLPGMSVAFATSEATLQDASAVDSSTAVDILITGEWPENILNCLDSGYGLPDAVVRHGSNGSPAAALFAKTLKPRYHFSGGVNAASFQRPPYSNGGGFPPTRFVGLAAVGTPKSPAGKWIHALSLSPLSLEKGGDATLAAVSGTTPNPHDAKPPADLSSDRFNAVIEAEKRSHQSSSFHFSNQPAGKRRRKNHRCPPARRPRFPPRMDCWFCVASPACESHLIAAVGDESYITLPRGGITPHHVLIVPIAHTGCFADLHENAISEVERYMSGIEKCFASRGMVPFFYERSVVLAQAAQRHAYLEAMALPSTAANSIETTFLSQAKAAGLRMESLDESSDGSSPLRRLCSLFGDEEKDNDEKSSSREYIFAQLPSGKAFVHRGRALKGVRGENDVKLPLQFGRAVACRIMGTMRRVQWKDCVVPKEKETAMTQQFREAFGHFDPSS